jgi:RHS repeat-associated protein
MRKRDNQERRFYDVDSIAYFRSKTVQSMGGSSQYNYSSFGIIESQLDPTFVQPYTFTSREWDTELGLYYYRARYYDPQGGKFTAFDPILRGIRHTESNSCKSSLNALPLQVPQVLNPYVYVRNNPINLTDPSGKAPWYGNYCGPGNNPGAPIDELDRACKAHDDCYGAAGLAARDVIITPPDPGRCQQAVCDEVLCAAARNFVPITAKQRVARRSVIALFCP